MKLCKIKKSLSVFRPQLLMIPLSQCVTEDMCVTKLSVHKIAQANISMSGYLNVT